MGKITPREASQAFTLNLVAFYKQVSSKESSLRNVQAADRKRYENVRWQTYKGLPITGPEGE